MPNKTISIEATNAEEAGEVLTECLPDFSSGSEDPHTVYIVTVTLQNPYSPGYWQTLALNWEDDTESFLEGNVIADKRQLEAVRSAWYECDLESFGAKILAHFYTAQAGEFCRE